MGVVVYGGELGCVGVVFGAGGGMEWLGAEEEGEDAGDERWEGWEAGADDGNVVFEGGPDGCFGVGFGEVAAADHGGEFVETGRAGGDDEDAYAKDEDDACFLLVGEVQFGEEGHGEDEDDHVCEDLDGRVGVPDWAIWEAVLCVGGAVERPEVADWDAEDEAADYHPQAGDDDAGHCDVGCDEEGTVVEDAGEED